MSAGERATLRVNDAPALERTPYPRQAGGQLRCLALPQLTIHNVQFHQRIPLTENADSWLLYCPLFATIGQK